VADIERLQTFSQHVAARREVLCDAANALAHATRESKRLSELERRAHVLAADAAAAAMRRRLPPRCPRRSRPGVRRPVPSRN
jgi:hypothetical protein